MSRDMTQRIMVLYIHPDTGPVMPMELDLMAVEVVALKVPGADRRDDARIREIARKIKEKFPKVDPESNWHEVASLIGRLSHAQSFNGVVLRLPGTIDIAPPTSSASPAPVKELTAQLEQFTKEIKQLRRELQKERQEHNATKARLYTAEGENKRLKGFQDQFDKLNREVADARFQVQQLQDKVGRARTIIQKARDDADAAQQETASVKLELEQARQEVSTFQAALGQIQEELSLLRQRANHADKAEQQFRETLERRDQEIANLQARLRYLTEDEDTSSSEFLDNDPLSKL